MSTDQEPRNHSSKSKTGVKSRVLLARNLSPKSSELSVSYVIACLGGSNARSTGVELKAVLWLGQARDLCRQLGRTTVEQPH